MSQTLAEASSFLNQSSYFEKCQFHLRKKLDQVCIEPKCNKRGLICNHCVYQEHHQHLTVPYEMFIHSLMEQYEKPHIKSNFQNYFNQFDQVTGVITSQFQDLSFKVQAYSNSVKDERKQANDQFKFAIRKSTENELKLLKTLLQKNDGKQIQSVSTQQDMVHRLFQHIETQHSVDSDSQEKKLKVVFKEHEKTKQQAEQALNELNQIRENLTKIIDQVKDLLGLKTYELNLQQDLEIYKEQILQQQNSKLKETSLSYSHKSSQSLKLSEQIEQNFNLIQEESIKLQQQLSNKSEQNQIENNQNQQLQQQFQPLNTISQLETQMNFQIQFQDVFNNNQYMKQIEHDQDKNNFQQGKSFNTIQQQNLSTKSDFRQMTPVQIRNSYQDFEAEELQANISKSFLSLQNKSAKKTARSQLFDNCSKQFSSISRSKLIPYEEVKNEQDLERVSEQDTAYSEFKFNYDKKIDDKPQEYQDDILQKLDQIEVNDKAKYNLQKMFVNDYFLEKFSQILKKKESLIKLQVNIDNGNFTNETMEVFVKAIESLQNLEGICLTFSNTIVNCGTHDLLCQAFAKLKKLKVVILLYDNEIDPLKAADALKRIAPHIQEINIKNNQQDK